VFVPLRPLPTRLGLQGPIRRPTYHYLSDARLLSRISKRLLILLTRRPVSAPGPKQPEPRAQPDHLQRRIVSAYAGHHAHLRRCGFAVRAGLHRGDLSNLLGQGTSGRAQLLNRPPRRTARELLPGVIAGLRLTRKPVKLRFRTPPGCWRIRIHWVFRG